MISVKGSLRRHLSWWKENIANQDIVEIIEHGYRLPLLEVPIKLFSRTIKVHMTTPIS
jgi:hypothetical protein